ncbi:MAG: type II toxin-antitoxin system PemK/MazF family toxin [Gudongella sp.]|nr:type II toxin-antitoxin system PemK/MazF family toxin [Gudongella sp.]
MKMEMNTQIMRGQIYDINLEGTKGSETNKHRPCLIVQCKKGNENAPTTIVIPITHRNGRNQPTQVEIKPWMLAEGFGDVTGIALAEQIRTIDRCRIGDLVGMLNPQGMAKIDNAILVSMGISM